MKKTSVAEMICFVLALAALAFGPGRIGSRPDANDDDRHVIALLGIRRDVGDMPSAVWSSWWTSTTNGGAQLQEGEGPDQADQLR